MILFELNPKTSLRIVAFGLLLSLVQPLHSQNLPLDFTTLAGLAAVGHADGPGPAAKFNLPTCLSLDGAGNIYVVDTYNDTVRKVTPFGAVSTLAGLAEMPGVTDGTNSSARFNQPSGLAVDSAGNVWVADTGSQTIRKISPAGLVVTIAGTANAAGYQDGPAAPNSPSGALFSSPNGIAVAANGNVYVADTLNNMIRLITNGTVTTLAGNLTPGTADGVGTAAQFYEPYALAVDGADNVYVADYGNNLIRRVTPAGVVATIAGFENGLFFAPGGIALDSQGNLYVGDTYHELVRKLTPDSTGTNWTAVTLAGMTNVSGNLDGTGAGARFFYPVGIAINGSGVIYVGDAGNNSIRQITTGDVVTTLAGPDESYGSADGSAAAARFDQPFAVALDAATNVYVADTHNSTIRLITPAGAVSTPAGLAGFSGAEDGLNNDARFNQPTGLGIDASGSLYLTDYGNSTVRKITPDATHANWTTTTLAGQAGTKGYQDGMGAAALFNDPYGVAVDTASNLYVTDSGNSVIRMITPGGAVSTYAGSPGVSGYRDGVGAAALFDYPTGIAIDLASNLYVTDTANEVIRKIAPGGQVTTLAGMPGVDGTNDGSGSVGLFSSPQGITVDAAGNIYVADTVNNTIRGLTRAGLVSTLAGEPRLAGSADGVGSAAQFDYPIGLAVGPSGTFYVADVDNNVIRKGFFYQALPVTLVSLRNPGGAFQFTFPTVAGEYYSIQQSTNLAARLWTSVSNWTGNGATFQFTASLTNAQQYFRVAQP